MTTENETPAPRSRMKSEQVTDGPGMHLGHASGIPTPPVVPAAEPRNRGGRPPAQAAPEIDYDKLAAAMIRQQSTQSAVNMNLTGGVSTERFAPDNPGDIILKDGTLATGGADIAAIDKPLHSDYVQELAFMEEELLVTVATVEDPNAENPVPVGVNGIFQYFFRGVPTKAKRKFVEGLIVKTSRVTTPETTNGAGERTNVIRQFNSQKYPFTVNRDPNPRGQAWLERRLSEVI